MLFIPTHDADIEFFASPFFWEKYIIGMGGVQIAQLFHSSFHHLTLARGSGQSEIDTQTPLVCSSDMSWIIS